MSDSTDLLDTLTGPEKERARRYLVARDILYSDATHADVLEMVAYLFEAPR